MSQPVARQGDAVTGTDLHVLMVPSPGGPVPTPTPLPFVGTVSQGCVEDVLVDGRPVAVVGSTATATTPHLALPPATFQRPPSNRRTVRGGSATVLAGGRAVARLGDPVVTCNDPSDQPTSALTSGSSSVVVA